MQTLDLVIVTYNRLGKLKKSLECYINQTHQFRNLIVVDNCSTDGTKEYLDEWEKEENAFFKKIILHTDDNLGGSGGFYLGQKKAVELKADWVFVADDDAYAEPTMVEEFYKFIESHETNQISAVCAKVLTMEGGICLFHRDRSYITTNEFKRVSAKIEEYENEFFSIDVLSYVGSFLNSKALKSYGLVNPNYFIYFDDTEHSVRLKKYGDIVVVPSIIITHESGADSVRDNNVISWRSFYYKRNITHLLLKHYPRIGLIQIYYLLKSETYRIIHHEKPEEQYLLYRKALLCALFGILGKDKKYKPGYKNV